jgi:lysophospholipase L1-like esterase
MHRVLFFFLLGLTAIHFASAQSPSSPSPQSPSIPPAAGISASQDRPTLSAEERAARIKAHQEQMLKDWPNLTRFRSANATIGSSVEVVFMGDSITELWGRQPEQFFPGKFYVNRGIGGQTTPQMLLRFQQDVVDLRPKVVVINGGTNDIAGNTGPSTLKMIEDNLKSMTEIAQANGIQVVLASVTPAYDYPWRKGLEPAEKVVELNNWMKNFCGMAGCTYADYFTPMADEKQSMKEGLSVDGIHPTAGGYRIMSPIAERAIQNALEKKSVAR